MAKKKVTAIAEELLRDFLAEEGYELYHSEFLKEGSDWFLRIFIDRSSADDGEETFISTEDCEKVSRFLSEKLDEQDPIEQNYYLEVSSPGMDRPLIREEHFLRYLGERVDIRLYRGKDGKKEISGRLDGFDGNSLRITDDEDKVWELEMTEIARARLAVIL